MPNGGADDPKTAVAERTTSLGLLVRRSPDARSRWQRPASVSRRGPTGQTIHPIRGCQPASALSWPSRVITRSRRAAWRRHHRRSGAKPFGWRSATSRAEGRHALVRTPYLIPAALSDLLDKSRPGSTSPADSLVLASSKIELPQPPTDFGVLRPKSVIAAQWSAATQADQHGAGHVPPAKLAKAELEELDDGEIDDSGGADLFTSPVGGGGAIGNWLKKFPNSARSTDDSGGGPPGADTPTHRTNRSNRGPARWCRRLPPGRPTRWSTSVPAGSRIRSGISPASGTDPTGAPSPRRYRPSKPGPGHHRRRTQRGPPARAAGVRPAAATPAAQGTISISTPRSRNASRCGPVRRPMKRVYLDNLRRRRDLSVLLLLDVSGFGRRTRQP